MANPLEVVQGVQASAMTFFPAVQYHRRHGLNCCVRNGNRCDPGPMVTDKQRTGLLARSGGVTGPTSDNDLLGLVSRRASSNESMCYALAATLHEAWLKLGFGGRTTAAGRCGHTFDRSYRSPEGISTLTAAADQPGGLPGVSRLRNQTSSSGGLPA